MDASAKSMITIQSDADGTKFLRNGIYIHNQTSKASKDSGKKQKSVLQMPPQGMKKDINIKV